MLRKLVSSLALLAAVTGFIVVFTDARGGDLAFAAGIPSTPPPNALQRLFASNIGVGFARTVFLDLRDTGTAAGTYTLRAAPSGSRALMQRLRLRVTAVEAGRRRVLYSGTLAGFRRLALGRLSPRDAARRFSFELSLPSTGDAHADNALQHLAARESLSWQVTSA